MTMAMRPRVALVNLGCRVNRVEIDLMASKLQRAGCDIVNQDQADVVVINTCAVTAEAQTKTRKAVRRAARLPQAPHVIATGCVAMLFASELRDVAPGVIVERSKERIPGLVMHLLGRDDGYTEDRGVLAEAPTPTGRMRPGIKIQDGCDNRCTFCIVWKARGRSRSLASSQIVEAVREACERGAREVVLTGINLGTYHAPAEDSLQEGAGLDTLLRHLMDVTDVERLRLSSIEPPDVTDALLDVMADSKGRVAPFLHVCLQSGCDSTLERMGRVYDTHQFRRVVEHARTKLEHLALGTDVIVGFPGETNDEFRTSYEFCEEMGFARMHVFRYSRRPGTPAAEAPNQIPASVTTTRGHAMRALAQRMRVQAMHDLVGTTDRVLVQAPGRAVSSGLFDVSVSNELTIGDLCLVRLVDVVQDTLVGVVA